MKLNRRKLCECNTCGLYVRSGKRFIRGHNPPGNKGKGKPKSPPQLCWCHCGEMTKPGNRYIKGHQRRGTHPTEEVLQKMRLSHGPLTEEHKQSIIIAMNRPEVKAKAAQTNARPEVKEKRSRALKIAWDKPGVREERSRSGRIAQNRPEINVKRSRSLKITNANPEVKERRSQSAKIAMNKPETKAKWALTESKPETKEKRSQSQRENWQDPEYREKTILSQTIAANRPEVKARSSQTATNSWQDPEYVKKQMKANNVKQNKMEKKLENAIIETLPNEYKFVGHGEVVIAGKCPDFININDQKKIIELYGDYWHQGQDPQDRIDIFAKYGYDTLVIWEHELKDMESLKEKINEFHTKINPYSIHG